MFVYLKEGGGWMKYMPGYQITPDHEFVDEILRQKEHIHDMKTPRLIQFNYSSADFAA